MSASGALIRAFMLFGTALALAGSSASAGGQDPASARPAAPLAVSLTITVKDSETGETLPARCMLWDKNGTPRYPPYNQSLYHVTNGGYFFAGEAFGVIVPAGLVTFRAQHGYEYAPFSGTVTVMSDTAITVPLERVTSLEALGWRSGDTHVHINHPGGYYTLTPAKALLMGRAEGLAVVNCLDNEYYFTGADDPVSTPDCIVSMTEEYRSSSYGHLGLLGLGRLIEPASTIWWPLLSDIADSAHAQDSALVIAAHPITTENFGQVSAWPGSGLARELPVDCIGSRIDGCDVASYSNVHGRGIELAFWYRLLNCGMRLPAAAGTDAVMNYLDSRQLGGFRVYVRSDGPLRHSSWLAGLAAGRTFVTNGPLITHFDLGGRAAGDDIDLPVSGSAVAGRIAVESAFPFDAVDIVANGVTRAVFNLPPGTRAIDTTFSVSFDRSAWVAARVRGSGNAWFNGTDTLFAHTSPVYVEVYGEPILESADAGWFAEWIADLMFLVAAEGSWGDPDERGRVLAFLAAAGSRYYRLAQGPTAAGGDEAARVPAALLWAAPNPSSGGAVIEFAVPSASSMPASRAAAAGAVPSVVRIAIYDAAGRLVRRLVNGAYPPGRHAVSWDGRDDFGAPAASGVYFARLDARGRAASLKMLLLR